MRHVMIRGPDGFAGSGQLIISRNFGFGVAPIGRIVGVDDIDHREVALRLFVNAARFIYRKQLAQPALASGHDGQIMFGGDLIKTCNIYLFDM